MFPVLTGCTVVTGRFFVWIDAFKIYVWLSVSGSVA